MTVMTRREWHLTALGGLATAVTARSDPAHHTQVMTGVSRAYMYLHYDVFTNQPLTGNQLAVFIEPQGLDAAAMQRMTREMNFSECTFVFPAEDPKTDIRVRIFGRNNEMPFAGHPTIGTAFALAHTGVIKKGQARTTVGLGIGPTPVDLEWKGDDLAFAWMTQRPPVFGKTIADIPALAAALGVDATAIQGVGTPPHEVSCGSYFLVVPMTTRQAVDSVTVDGRAMEIVFKGAGMDRRGVFVFSPEKAGDDAVAYSRMVGATGFEDPATGSATGPLACYLRRHRLVSSEQAKRMVGIQGVRMQRPSRLYMSLDTKGDEITGVRVGGESVLVGEGTLRT
jgi:trans-2,3-dihydro-3-hydroxyanthranilate isomerase